MAHGFCGIVALALGPLLVFEGALASGWGYFKAPSHRVVGRIYVLAVLGAGSTGYHLALIAYGGWTAQLGFATLAVLWIFTLGKALGSIRRGDASAHRQWMARNYALTFSAVTLRVMLSVGQYAGISLPTLYPWSAWLCWSINLLGVELILRSRREA